MKIAVLGAGAMGSLFGGRLAEAGFDVRLVDVDAAHIDAVQRNGLRLASDDGDRRILVPIARAEAYRETVDLLVVFTKGPQTKAALASARHLAGAGTWALTLQNGLGTGERLGEVFPRERILIGMTNWPADLRGPGHVSSHGAGEVRLWTLAGHEHPFIATVSQALSRAGLACTADAGVVVAIWEKATFNAAMNSIASVTGFDVGGMADDPDIQALVRTVLDECTAVAQASGVPVSRERIDEAVRHAFATHRPHKPSMLQDILAGRATEIESINGAIVEHAQRAGVAAPAVRALLQLVRARERKARS